MKKLYPKNNDLMIYDQLIISNINSIIKIIESEYQNCQGLILTEDDLKCILFMKLYPHFNNCQKTMDDGINGSSVHSEISFFDSSGVLKYRPDITILDPQHLSILHSIEYNINSLKSDKLLYSVTKGKEFEFGGSCIIFELKFYRSKKGITKKKLTKIKKDIRKIYEIQRLASLRNSNVAAFLVIFNKTNIVCDDFNILIQNLNGIEVIYGTGNVSFTDNESN